LPKDQSCRNINTTACGDDVDFESSHTSKFQDRGMSDAGLKHCKKVKPKQ